MSFRFHFLGMPHTWTSRIHSHCAYTSKVVKALKMFSQRGHTCYDYSNEGADVDCFERVQILTEKERAGFFGEFDRHKLYDIRWDPNEPYWKLFNARCVDALRSRVCKGDYIMTLSGNCQVGPVGDAFPGSYAGDAQTVMMVEWGVGYLWVVSRYACYESETHREWMHGKRDSGRENNDDACVPNFFDLSDFVVPASVSSKWDEFQQWLRGRPYYAFVGRVTPAKGTVIADEVAADLGVPLVIAGQGNWNVPDVASDMVFKFGAANVAERAAIMTNAIAGLNPTTFREPFGGTSVEFQLCGTPAITTDHGAFTQNVAREWRCASHREFVEAARRAQILTPRDRHWIRTKAEERFSLEAVAPLYERYFERLKARFWGGWYEMRDTTDLEIP